MGNWKEIDTHNENEQICTKTTQIFQEPLKTKKALESNFQQTLY